MPELSQRIQQLAQEHVDGELFTSADDVLVAALTLFKQFHTQQRIRQQLQLAAKQLDAGEGMDLDTEGLRSFLQSVKDDGRTAIPQ